MTVMRMFIGNEQSMKVHIEGCEFAEKIHPLNLTIFEELFDALGQEYSECGYCFGGGRDREHRFVYVRQRKEEKKRKAACLVCGETRGTQMAHIIARRHGGTATMPLCPNHHWNYDHGLLTKKETKTIRIYIRKRR